MPEIKNLYQWLEEDFDPLRLCKDVESVTKILSENEELNTYVKPLQDIAVVKLLNQVIIIQHLCKARQNHCDSLRDCSLTHQ